MHNVLKIHSLYYTTIGFVLVGLITVGLIFSLSYTTGTPVNSIHQLMFVHVWMTNVEVSCNSVEGRPMYNKTLKGSMG